MAHRELSDLSSNISDLFFHHRWLFFFYRKSRPLGNFACFLPYFGTELEAPSPLALAHPCQLHIVQAAHSSLWSLPNV